MGDLNNGHRPSFPQALKREGKGTTSPLPTPFDHDFKLHVIPSLHRGAKRLAPLVAQQLIGFDEAMDTLSAMAVRRGATYLANDNHFFDALSIYLSDRCEEARQALEVAP